MRYRINLFKILLKLFVAYVVLHLFKRRLLKENIWLVMEKRTEARDNGYHFFKFLREKHPEIHAYYAITDDSSDRIKIEKYGNLIKADSFEHYIYYLASRYSINSQAYGAAPNNPRIIHKLKNYFAPKQKTIFLQHGIIKDDMADAYHYNLTKFDLFCCGARREQEYIISKYGYPPQKARLLGLCRYDRLYNNKNMAEKTILIMPTFRNWLQVKDPTKTATEDEKKNFIESRYYQSYSKVLSDEKLLLFARTNEYSIVFYPHYAMQPYIDTFKQFENDIIKIASRKDYDVQELLINSCLLITDYSSVYFDFAYMGKPVIYYQFDEDEYRGKHYRQGYFDYREDGFGPVFNNETSVVEYIRDTFKISMNIENKYLERTIGFYGFNDAKNCERTFEAIIEVGQE